jgi:4-amino-4-deoxy-L-arabinose transferase-like glycosyltransferase
MSALRNYFWLAAIVLAFRLATALPLDRAGYMDASYTVHIAEQLARGRGFTEEVLWNYLDAPTALPHPSNLYWMPLPAVLAAASFLVFGISYHAAQLPFILLSLVPPLFAFYLARRIFNRNDYAWMVGLLTAFSGFYTIYWVAPDNFTPFAVTTDLALLWMVFALGGKKGAWFVAGVLAGLSQLARADGFLLLAVVPVTLVLTRRSLTVSARGTLIALLGFVLVLAPWLARNYLVAGSPLGPGGTHTLFLTSYQDLFRYDASGLTLAHYLDWGLANILASKLGALGFDLAVLLLGALQIFLAPFALIGAWQLRGRVEFKPALIYAGLLLSAMVLVFTFPGMHGSMLHSSAALVAFGAVAAPPGLDAAIQWIARRRKRWNERRAQVFFRTGFVALAFGLALFTYSQGVFRDVLSTFPSSPLWNQRDEEYRAVGQALDALGVPATQPVLTVDPPSFFNMTGRRSIYIPSDDLAAIQRAAQQFGAHYLVLQDDRPSCLDDLYAGRVVVDGWMPIARFKDAVGRPVVLYEIE